MGMIVASSRLLCRTSHPADRGSRGHVSKTRGHGGWRMRKGTVGTASEVRRRHELVALRRVGDGGGARRPDGGP